MSLDARARRAANGIYAATEGVDSMSQLDELQHRDKVRRRSGVVVAVTLLLLVAASAGWGVSTKIHGSQDAGPATPPSPTVPSPTVSAAPQLLDYGNGDIGVEVTTPSEVDRLTGAPEDFKSFVAGLVTALNFKALNYDNSCPDAKHSVTVQKIRTDGFAVGGVNSCGGYAALWATANGTWKQIEGAQEMWDCKVLKKYLVPSDIAGDQCYDYSGTNKEEPYNQL